MAMRCAGGGEGPVLASRGAVSSDEASEAGAGTPQGGAEKAAQDSCAAASSQPLLWLIPQAQEGPSPATPAPGLGLGSPWNQDHEAGWGRGAEPTVSSSQPATSHDPRWRDSAEYSGLAPPPLPRWAMAKFREQFPHLARPGQGRLHSREERGGRPMAPGAQATAGNLGEHQGAGKWAPGISASPRAPAS